MRVLSYLFLFIIIIFGVSFAILNADSVTINYYFDQMTLPISLLVVIIFAAGCLVGIFVSLTWIIKLKLSNYHLKRNMQALEKKCVPPSVPLQEKG